jgi:hypothetical protein
MLHLSPTHHEISQHDSPHEYEGKIEPRKCPEFKFKPRHVNDSSHIKPRHWPLSFSDVYNRNGQSGKIRSSSFPSSFAKQHMPKMSKSKITLIISEVWCLDMFYRLWAFFRVFWLNFFGETKKYMERQEDEAKLLIWRWSWWIPHQDDQNRHMDHTIWSPVVSYGF